MELKLKDRSGSELKTQGRFGVQVYFREEEYRRIKALQESINHTLAGTVSMLAKKKLDQYVELFKRCENKNTVRIQEDDYQEIPKLVNRKAGCTFYFEEIQKIDYLRLQIQEQVHRKTTRASLVHLLVVLTLEEETHFLAHFTESTL